MKKTLIFTLTALLLLTLLPCAQASTADDALSLRGLTLISDMTTLAADEHYIAALTMPPELADIASGIAAESFETPAHIYRLTADMKLILGLLAPYDLSETVQRQLYTRVFNSISSILIGRLGVNWVATSSVLTVTDCFTYELAEPVLYIYEYPHEYSIMVSFIPGLTQDAVIMNGTFIPTEVLYNDGQFALNFDQLGADVFKIETIK